MDRVPELLEGTNFATLHGLLTFSGAMLSVLVMQLTSWAGLDDHDPLWLQWINRFWRAALALALLWSFLVVSNSSWDPFRPGIVVLIVLDLSMAFRALTLVIAIRRRREINIDGGGSRLQDQPFFEAIGRRPVSRARRSDPFSWGHH